MSSTSIDRHPTSGEAFAVQAHNGYLVAVHPIDGRDIPQSPADRAAFAGEVIANNWIDASCLGSMAEWAWAVATATAPYPQYMDGLLALAGVEEHVRICPSDIGGGWIVYTAQEWDDSDIADYEINDAGELEFQGGHAHGATIRIQA